MGREVQEPGTIESDRPEQCRNVIFDEAEARTLRTAEGRRLEGICQHAYTHNSLDSD